MATLYILYGSATGNAENIAKTLAKESLPTNGFSQTVCEPLEKYRRFQDVWKDKPSSSSTAVKQEYHGILVVVSTTGNGDAPENASRFVRFLKRKTTSPDTFQNCAFGVLALGDTNYDQFCNSGKTIDKRLKELGGHRAKDLACADEATGLEQVVEPWTATVLQDIHNTCFPSTTTSNSCCGTKKEEQPRSSCCGTETEQPRSSCCGTENKEPVAKAETIDTEPSTTEASPTETRAPETATTTTASETTVTESVQKEPTTTTTTTTSSCSSKKDKDDGPCSCCPQPPAPSADYVQPTPPPATPVDQSSSPLFVLYASKTGNAEHIAKDLAATYETLIKNPIAKTYFPSVVCCELDQFKKRCVSHWDEAPPAAGAKHGVIVVSSTTGNGEIPENGNRFERYIKRRTTPKTAFQHVAYAVLGLGDTNYDIFCAAAKNIDKKLAELAGTRVQPLACADEATGLEEGVEPFINSILVTMNDFCRPPTANASPATTSKQSAAAAKSTKSSEAEEKKEADTAPVKSKEMAPPPTTTSSRGVRLVRSLLDIPESEMLPEVHPSDLPGMTSSLSSCELISEEGRRNRSHSLAEQDNMTAVSSVSTNALHYTHTRPYTSTIVGARYLTNSSTDAAKEATKILAEDTSEDDDEQKIQQAMRVYERHFSLVGEQADRNSKRVVEMSFSLPDDSTYDYQPGDSVGLIVSNPPQAVQFILDMLKQHHGIVETQRVRLDSSRGPITVKEALCQHIDLSSPIKNRRIVHSLSGFATDPHEIFALQHIACKSSRGSLFQRYMEDQRITIVELLRDFPSCQSIPLEGLFSMLSSIPPRYYSVSSSPLKSKRSLTVAFSVVDYMTPSLPNYDSRRVGGVATRHLEVLASPFLSGQQDGPSRWKLRIFPKPSVEFRLPILESTPMVLIGPGTGIAPFVGFLHHRQAQKEATKAAAQQVVEGTWRGGYEVEQDELQCDDDATAMTPKNASIRVYFGCRHENHDFLYRNELGSFAKQGLIELHKVHSRDNNNSDDDKKEKYVQDVMDASLVDWIVHQKAMVYVCGDGNAMAKDVQRKIVELLEGSVENPLEYLDTMKKQHRFVMDIWS